MSAADVDFFLSSVKDPETGESYFAREYLESSIEADDQIIFLAFAGGVPVGLASCRACDLHDQTKKDTTHLYQVFVMPEHEGKGIGRALMGAYEEWSQQQQKPQATLFVHTKNKRAVDLYVRGGYAGYFNDLSAKITPQEVSIDTGNIVRAGSADYKDYASLVKNAGNHILGKERLSRQDFENAENSGDDMIFAVRSGNKAIAFANMQQMYCDNDRGVLEKSGFYLNNLVIARDIDAQQKRDVLTQLRAVAMKGCLNDAEMFCSVRTGDIALLEILHKSGFQTYGQMMRKTVGSPLQQPS